MRKLLKRLACGALTLAMMVTMLPVQSAYAAREQEKPVEEETITWEHFEHKYAKLTLTEMLDHLYGSWDDGNVIISPTRITLKRAGGRSYDDVPASLSCKQAFGPGKRTTYVYQNPYDVMAAEQDIPDEEYEYPEVRLHRFYASLEEVDTNGESESVYLFIETRRVVGNEFADYLRIVPGDEDYTDPLAGWTVRYKDVDGEKVCLSEVIKQAYEERGYDENYTGSEYVYTPDVTFEEEPTPTVTPEQKEEPTPTVTPEPTEEPKKETVNVGRTVYEGEDIYKVVKGDCLWAIAKRFLGNGKRYIELYERNKDIIKVPELIYPGQEIIYPVEK